MTDKQALMDKWAKMYGFQISETEYDEIVHNLKNFFDLLHEWDQEEKAQKSLTK